LHPKQRTDGAERPVKNGKLGLPGAALPSGLHFTAGGKARNLREP